MSKAKQTLAGSLLAAFPLAMLPAGAGLAQDLPSFAIVSGQSLTNTGPTTIGGNIAVSPGTSYTGSGSVTQVGAVFLGDATAIGIQSDLTSLYNVLEGRPTSQGGDLTGQDLGGLTLQAGVYHFDSSASIAAGQTLILDGGGNPDAVFIFNIGSTLTAGSGARVVLQNGAQGGNVFYRVGSSATLDTSSTLHGQIVALTSITLNTAASIPCGAAQARNGSITLDTNTIVICRLAAEGFGTPLVGAGASTTQAALAAALADHVAAGGTLPLALAILPATQSGAELAASLSQLTGEVSTGVAPMGLRAMSGFLDTVVQSGGPLRLPARAARDDGVPVGMVPEKINSAYVGKYGSAPVSPASVAVAAAPRSDWNLWVSGYGSTTRADADPVLGYQANSSRDRGIAVGLNHSVNDSTDLGMAISWNVAAFDLADQSGRARAESVFVALRGRTTSDRAYVEGALAFGRSDITTNRTVTIAGLDRFAGATTGESIAGYVEAGYHFGAVTPFAALRAQSFETTAYSETTVEGASSYALDHGTARATSLRSELGVELGRSMAMTGGGSSSFGVRAAWAHDFAGTDPTSAEFQSLPGVTFPVSAGARDRDSVILSASVGMATAGGISVDGSLNLEQSANARSYGGALTLGYRW